MQGRWTFQNRNPGPEHPTMPLVMLNVKRATYAHHHHNADTDHEYPTTQQLLAGTTIAYQE